LRRGPTPVEEFANWLLHRRVVAAAVDAVFWSVVPVAAAVVAAPVTLLLGVVRTAAEVGRVVGCIRSEVHVSERARMAVVVTGCDSGFGRAVALALSRRGYTVFAGCLFPGARQPLQAEAAAGRIPAGGQFRPLVLDVTRESDVAEAAERVRQWVSSSADHSLLAVVNNAGVGSGGLIDWLTLSDFERDAAVNYFGTVRVSKAFLPLLKQAAAQWTRRAPRPRVVVVCSASGKVAVPLLSSYAASKHAVACFAACLRMELSALWDIDVCTVFPSFHQTPLLETGAGTIDRTWSAAPAEARRDYGEGFGDAAKALATFQMSVMAWDASVVVEGVVGAATQLHRPPPELFIGADARYVLLPCTHLPAWLLDKFLIFTGLGMLPAPARRG